MRLSDFARIKWERARDLRKRGDYEGAEKELKEALAEEPHHGLLKSSLAGLYLRQQRFIEARILAEEIISSDPQQPQGLYVLGEIFAHEKAFEEALQCFRQASQRDPRPYLALRIARTLREMGRCEEALETVDARLIKDGEDPPFLKEKALILVRLNRLNEALRCYEKLQAHLPDDPFVRKEVYRLRGRKQPAQQMIRELQAVVNLPSRKDDAQLHGLLGQKLKDAGKLGEALVEFKQARRLAPDNVYFLKWEGFCHYHLGAMHEAVQALSEAFRKDPNDFIVKSTLQKIYTTTDNIKGFIDLVEDVLKAHPHNMRLVGILKGLRKRAQEKA